MMSNSKEDIVCLTPNQLFQMDVGIEKDLFFEDEYDDLFPVLAEELKDMVRETTVGAQNGTPISVPVENSDCKMYLCIEIAGKLCKVHSEEYNTLMFGKSLSVERQVKLFQRLISEGQLSLNDLAKADIDNAVYKKLVINDLEGVNLCREKIEKIDSLVQEQKDDKSLEDLRNKLKQGL